MKVFFVFALSCAFLQTAFGELIQPALTVDGTPIAGSRPVTRIGKQWYVPLLPVARALGAEVIMAPDIQGIRVRRRDGIELTYDGRTGEIRNRFILLGQVSQPQQIQIVALTDDLLFPVEGIVPLLGVMVAEDVPRNLLRIQSQVETAPHDVSRGPMVNVTDLRYRYGLSTNLEQYGQFMQWRGEGLVGGLRVTGDGVLSQYPGRSVLGMSQGYLKTQFSGDRFFIWGDQGTNSGMEALMAPLRGFGFESSIRGVQTSFFSGRTAGARSTTLGSIGFAR